MAACAPIYIHTGEQSLQVLTIMANGPLSGFQQPRLSRKEAWACARKKRERGKKKPTRDSWMSPFPPQHGQTLANPPPAAARTSARVWWGSHKNTAVPGKKQNSEQCPLWRHCLSEQSQKPSTWGETILEQETDMDPLPVQGLNLGTAAFGGGPQWELGVWTRHCYGYKCWLCVYASCS